MFAFQPVHRHSSTDAKLIRCLTRTDFETGREETKVRLRWHEHWQARHSSKETKKEVNVPTRVSRVQQVRAQIISRPAQSTANATNDSQLDTSTSTPLLIITPTPPPPPSHSFRFLRRRFTGNDGDMGFRGWDTCLYGLRMVAVAWRGLLLHWLFCVFAIRAMTASLKSWSG